MALKAQIYISLFPSKSQGELFWASVYFDRTPVLKNPAYSLDKFPIPAKEVILIRFPMIFLKLHE